MAFNERVGKKKKNRRGSQPNPRQAPEGSAEQPPARSLFAVVEAEACEKTLAELQDDLYDAGLLAETDDHRQAVCRWCLLQLMRRTRKTRDWKSLLAKVHYEVADSIRHGHDEFLVFDDSNMLYSGAKGPAFSGSPIIPFLLLSPSVCGGVTEACADLLQALALGCKDDAESLLLLLDSHERVADVKATMANELAGLGSRSVYELNCWPVLFRAAAHLWCAMLPKHLHTSMAFKVLFSALAGQEQGEPLPLWLPELRLKPSVSIITLLRANEDSRIHGCPQDLLDKARARLRCYTLALFHPVDEMESATALLDVESDELCRRVRDAVMGVGTLLNLVPTASPSDICTLAPSALRDFVGKLSSGAWTTALAFVGLDAARFSNSMQVSRINRAILRHRGELERLFCMLKDARDEVLALSPLPDSHSHSRLDWLTPSLFEDHENMLAPTGSPNVSALVDEDDDEEDRNKALASMSKSDCAVIVGAVLEELEARTMLGQREFILKEIALPVARLFRVLPREPEGHGQWWKPFVAEKSVIFLEGLDPASNLEDDRVIAFSGSELLDGAGAGLLWMQRSNQSGQVLFFDTEEHILHNVSQSSKQQFYVELAPLLRTPYITTTPMIPIGRAPAAAGGGGGGGASVSSTAPTMSRQLDEINPLKPWRRYRVIGLRLQSENLSELQSILNDLHLNQSAFSSRATDVSYILDIATLFAVCKLCQSLRDQALDNGSYEAKRVLMLIEEDARQNPLLADFLPAQLRSAVLAWRPRLASFLRLNTEYWERRLGLSAGEHADMLGRLLVQILATDGSHTSPVYVLDGRTFALLTRQLRDHTLGSTLWRPIVERMVLAKTNLAAILQQLFELASRQCFSVIFFAFEADVTAREVARLLQPFITPGSPLRFILQDSSGLVDDLQMTDVGRSLAFPQKKSGGPRATQLPMSGSACGQMFSLLTGNSQLQSQLAEQGLNDLAMRNASLANWPKRLHQLLDADPNDHVQTFLLLVQPDHVVIDAMIKVMKQRLGQGSSHPPPTYRTLDANQSEFYNNFDSFLALCARKANSSSSVRRAQAGAASAPSTTASARATPSSSPAKIDRAPSSVPSKTTVSFLVIQHADLLSPEELRSILQRLARSGIKAVVCLASLSPAAMRLDARLPFERVVVNLGHCVPFDSRDLVQYAITRVGASPSAADSAADLQYMICAVQVILGRHFTGQVALQLVERLLTGDSAVHAFVSQSSAGGQSLPPLAADFLNDLALSSSDSAVEAARGPQQQGLSQAEPSRRHKSRQLDLLLQLYCHVRARMGQISSVEQSSSCLNVSFDQFALCAPVAQVCPPRELVGLWLEHGLGLTTPENGGDLRRRLQAIIPNVVGASFIELLAGKTGASLDGDIVVTTRCVLQDDQTCCQTMQPFAARGEQLPYPHIDKSFHNSPPSFADLQALLLSSAQPLLVVASCPPRTLDIVLLNASRAELQELIRLLTPGPRHSSEAIGSTDMSARHLELVQTLFEQCSATPGHETVLCSLAVLLYHLLKSSYHRCEHLRLEGAHIERLLASGLFIRLDSASAESMMALLFVLDGPPTLLVDQPELCAWLVNGCSLVALDKLLLSEGNDGAQAWGMVLLNAILSPRVKDCVPRSVLSQTKLAAFVYSLLGGDDLAQARAGMETLLQASLVGPSPAFVASMLARLAGRPGAHVDLFCDFVAKFLSKAADSRASGRDATTAFLMACTHRHAESSWVPEVSPASVYRLFRKVHEHKPSDLQPFKRKPSDLQQPTAASDETAMILWYLAAGNKAGVDDCLKKWIEHATSPDCRVQMRSLPLHLDGTDDLRAALLDHWRNAIQKIDVAGQDASWIGQVVQVVVPAADCLQRAAILALLQHLSANHLEHCETRAPIVDQLLATLLWSYVPDREWPLQPMQSGSQLGLTAEVPTFQLLRALPAQPSLAFSARVWRTIGAVPLALWLIAPERLPLPMLEAFHARFFAAYGDYDKQLALQRTTLLFAQRHDNRACTLEVVQQRCTPYAQQWWQEFLRNKKELLHFSDEQLKLGVSQLAFFVDQGVDQDILSENARTLALILDPRHQPTLANVESDSIEHRADANLRYIFNVVCLWFELLGIRFEELLDELSPDGDPRKIKRYFLDAQRDPTYDTFVDRPCWIAVPTAIDTHHRTGMSLLRYFGDSDQDVHATHSAVAAFLPFELSSRLVTKSSGDLASSLIGVMGYFAHWLVEELNGLEDSLANVSNEDVRDRSVQVRTRVRLFAACLKAFYKQGHSAREHAVHMLRVFIVQLADAVKSKRTPTAAYARAWIFRWICRGFGFSASSQELDRQTGTSIDRTPQNLLRETLGQIAVEPYPALCKATLQELNGYFDHPDRRVFQEGSGLAKSTWMVLIEEKAFALVEHSADREDTSVLDFFSKTQRDCVRVRYESLHPTTRSAELAGVELPGAELDAYQAQALQSPVQPVLPSPSITSTRLFKQLDIRATTQPDASEHVQFSDSGGAGPSSSSMQQGLVSFRFKPTSKMVVVRAPSLVCLRSASVQDSPVQAHIVEIDQGPGGALVMAQEDETRVVEAESTFEFVDKRTLHSSDLQGCRILQTFPSHERAWAFFETNLPDNAILVGANVMFKRSQLDNSLCPLFLSDRETAALLFPPDARQSFDPSVYTLADAMCLGPMLNYFGLCDYIYDLLALCVAIALAPRADDERMGDEEVEADQRACDSPGRGHVDAAATLDGWIGQQIARFQRLRAQGFAADKLASASERLPVRKLEKELKKLWDDIGGALAVTVDVSAEEKKKSTVCERFPHLFASTSVVPENLHEALENNLEKALQKLNVQERYREFVKRALTEMPHELVPSYFLQHGVSGQTEAEASGTSFAFPLPEVAYRTVVSKAAGELVMQANTSPASPSVFGVRNPQRDGLFVEQSAVSGAAAVLFPKLEWTATAVVRVLAHTQTGATDAMAHGYLLHLGDRNLSGLEPVWAMQVLSAPLPVEYQTWMLRVVLLDAVLKAPEIDPRKSLHRSVVAYSLADTCPFEEARPFLLEAFALPHPLQDYFGHIAGVYGLYICSSDTLPVLQLELKVPLRVLDIGELHARGVVAKDQIYAEIVRQFTDDVIVCYVRNAHQIADQLLKWCAEFTKGRPYAFIYFEDLNTDRNFSENRDRCNMHLYMRPSLQELNVTSGGGGGGGGRDMDDDSGAGPDDDHSGGGGKASSRGAGGAFASVESICFAAVRSLESKSEDGAEDEVAANSSLSIIKRVCPDWQRPNSGLWNTKACGNWKQTMHRWLNSAEESAAGCSLHAFIIISAPGAGKTHFIENNVSAQLKEQMARCGGAYEYFDASSSRLVREALAGLLERQCPAQAKQLALVVDEFHMLSAKQKTQLFHFLSGRSKGKDQEVRCIMIGNRAEKHDRDLVDQWRAQVDSLHVEFVMARLPAVHMRSLCAYEKWSPDVQELVHWWLAAVRMLFSDDALTFRILESVLEAMKKPIKDMALSEVLCRKLPQLGQLTCQRISFFVLQLHSRFSDKLSLDPTEPAQARLPLEVLVDFASENDADPFALLTRCALVASFTSSLDYPQIPREAFNSKKLLEGLVRVEGTEAEEFEEEPDSVTLMSVPEYVNELPGGGRLHPLLRIEAWALYVYDKLRQALWRHAQQHGKGLEEVPDPDTTILRRLVLIDQPGFPLVTDVALSQCSVQSCRAFAETGDYTDLEWIRVSLQRNAAVSWAVARRTWRSAYISNVPGLLQLLDECPDPESCLRAVAPTNLCSLLSTTLGTELGCQLAGRVVELLAPTAADWAKETDDVSNPLLHALWCLYIQQDDSLGASAGRHVAVWRHTIAEGDDGGRQLLQAMLMWAAAFVGEQLRVACSPEAAQARLARDLEDVVRRLAAAAVAGGNGNSSGSSTKGRGEVQSGTSDGVQRLAQLQSSLSRLYGGVFASLAPSPAVVMAPQMQRAVFWLAASQYPPHPHWPADLATLCQLLHHRESDVGLDAISTWPLFASPARDAGFAVVLPDDPNEQVLLARSLLDPQSVTPLPVAWQVALLTQLKTPWLDDLGELKKLVTRAQWLSVTFEAGLRYLFSSKQIWPQWAGPEADSIRKRLQDMFRHLHGVEDVSKKQNPLDILRQSQERRNREIEEQSMAEVSRKLRVNHPAILRFYNSKIGFGALEGESDQDIELDEYKNPKSSQYDLARDKAFADHTGQYAVVIGNFSSMVDFVLIETKVELSAAADILPDLHWRPGRGRGQYWVLEAVLEQIKGTFGAAAIQETGERQTLRELPTEGLKRNVEQSLAEKGFAVRIVDDEEMFVRELESGQHDVAWVISDSAQSVGERSQRQAERGALLVGRVAMACQAFHRLGKGLFLFGENSPLYFHANAVLEQLDGSLQLTGNNIANRFITTIADMAELPEIVRKRHSSGSFNRQLARDHALSTGIRTLYEGKTIAYPDGQVRKPWQALVTGGADEGGGGGGGGSGSNQPVIVVRDGDSDGRAGRVVVDTGYTKLWLNWREGGTNRYVCNATAWLTGIDARLRGIHEKTLPHPQIADLRWPQQSFRTPQPEQQMLHRLAGMIEAEMPKGMDVILIIDMSGSMSSYFAEARAFAAKMVEEFEIGVRGSRNRMGLIPFGTNVGQGQVANLGSDRRTLEKQIARLDHDLGGTNFAPPLKIAVNQFNRHGESGQTRLVIFQTDGDNWDVAPGIAAAQSLVDGANATVFGIAVGNGTQRVANITGRAGRFHDPSKGLALVRTLRDYNELVQEVKSIRIAAAQSAL